MQETEYDATVDVDADDALEEEYPTCYKCDAPIAYFVHTNAIGYVRVCSDPDCPEGLEAMCNQQIPETTIQHCIDAVGVDTLRERLDGALDRLNDYREDNGLDPVETP